MEKEKHAAKTADKNMKGRLSKVKDIAFAHKFISIIVFIIFVLSVYWIVRKVTTPPAVTRYVTSTVEQGTIITSVTGTGQVSASTELALEPQASGIITYVGVKDGQSVKAGDIIAQLDTTTQNQTIANAKANLTSAQISLAKLQEPPTQLELTQDQDAVTEGQQQVVQDQANLAKDYDNAFTAVSNAFLDLPTTVAGVENTLYKVNANGQDNASYYADLVQNFAPTVATYEDSAITNYETADTAYSQNFLDYKGVSRTDATSTILSLLNETYNTTELISEAVKSSSDLFSFVNQQLVASSKPVPSALTGYQNSLSSYTNTSDTDLTNLLNSINTINNDQNTLTNDTLGVTEKKETLAQLKAGPDPLDVQSSQLAVTQAQNALTVDEQNLNNYYVVAPFDGVVANLTAQVGANAGSGSALATLITNTQVADITLNEIDAAKVKDGQVATLTFDAIPGLSIAGVVTDVAAIGTVSQGVVTYTIDISFQTQDPRVKPGMSVSVAIVTGVDQDVLEVPNAAIKTQGTMSYVQVFNPPLSGSNGSQGAASSVLPQNKVVQAGDSNDTMTEILSGVSAGDQIVVRTIVPTTGTAATTATPSATSLLGASGRGTFGGGGFGGGGGATRTTTTAPATSGR